MAHLPRLVMLLAKHLLSGDTGSKEIGTGHALHDSEFAGQRAGGTKLQADSRLTSERSFPLRLLGLAPLCRKPCCHSCIALLFLLIQDISPQAR